MKISTKEIREGSNRFDFEIDAIALQAFLQEVDDLYVGQGASLPLSMEIRKTRGILQVRCEVATRVAFECARCLRPSERAFETLLDWTLIPASQLQSDSLSDEEEVELTSDDLNVSFFRGEEIDLQDLVRELILLELDPIPTCAVDDCLGSAYLSASPEEEAAEPTIDPRWGPLAALQQKMKKN